MTALARFPHPRVLLVVVHVLNEHQARENAALAFEQGADGVLFIDHDRGTVHSLRNVVSETRRFTKKHRAFEAGFLGINVLGTAPHLVLEELARGLGLAVVDAVWSDNAGDEAGLDRFRATRRTTAWGGLHLGGVAFKGQPVVNEAELGIAATFAARNGVDIVTTSGPRTGEPPPLDKIVRMRRALALGLGRPDYPLAVASGIDIDNVDAFLPLVDVFVVASSLETTFGTLDGDKVHALAAKIHAWGSAS